ncbi:MAG: isoaspartyl peptidase/L-asparaginase [Candidatus Thorarchaeota archaeon]
MSELSLPVVLVHGGATTFKKKSHSAVLEAVSKAAERGMCVLDSGGSPIDAIESAIWLLEETDLFTAGKGGCKNSEGVVELDAIIMDGHRLESGAVMAVSDVLHPISLARYVLDRTPVTQVAGEGAKKLYGKMITDGYRGEETAGESKLPPLAEPCDTVGCIAVDKHGRIAVGSSTSGWPGMLPGRVGDTPIIGSGVYANEAAGVACTGKGEQILRLCMARMAVSYVENGMSPADAADKSVCILREKTAGQAGLIIVDSTGEIGIDFDTLHMPVALCLEGPRIILNSMKPDF